MFEYCLFWGCAVAVFICLLADCCGIIDKITLAWIRWRKKDD